MINKEVTMNLIETYLEELYSVKDYVPEWADKFPDRTFVLVNAKSWSCCRSGNR